MRSLRTFIHNPPTDPACVVVRREALMPMRFSHRTRSTPPSPHFPRLAFGSNLQGYKRKQRGLAPFEAGRASRPSRRMGFTLLEILVVLGIFSILGALGLIASMDMYRGFAFRNDRDMLVNLLEKARNESINNICISASCTGGQPHGVRVAANQYVIFQGPSYALRDTTADEFVATQYRALTIGAGSLSEVVFKQLNGDVATAGTITLLDGMGHASVVSMSGEGRISWTN